MKKIILTFFALFISFSFLNSNLYSQSENVGIGVSSPQNSIHTFGYIQSDTLASSEKRVASINPNGVFEAITGGFNNDFLVKTPQGPAWKSSNTINTGSNCPPFECPTTFSTTSSNGMYFGACLRYCGTLEEDGYTDWRVPSIDETLHLAPYIPAENVGIWTTTTFTYTADPSWPGSQRQVTFNLTTGDKTVIIAVNQTIYCKCVR